VQASKRVPTPVWWQQRPQVGRCCRGVAIVVALWLWGRRVARWVLRSQSLSRDWQTGYGPGGRPQNPSDLFVLFWCSVTCLFYFIFFGLTAACQREGQSRLGWKKRRVGQAGGQAGSPTQGAGGQERSGPYTGKPGAEGGRGAVLLEHSTQRPAEEAGGNRESRRQVNKWAERWRW